MSLTHLEPQDHHLGASIFVSVPSYRDTETPRTLQQLFATAANPNRVTVLVNEQNVRNVLARDGNNDVSATTFPGSNRYGQQIRVLEQDASEALGPIVARSQIETELYTPGEADYWLQIDAHTAFVKKWDVRLIEQHDRLPDPNRGILTCFPDDYDPANRRVPDVGLPSFIGFHDFNERRGLPTQQRYRYRTFPSKSRESLFYAAGFTFGPAALTEEIPFDPTLRYLFLGEEISMAARLYTSGIRLYNPTSMLVYHLSNRNYRPTFWEQFHVKNSRATPAERKERKEIEQQSLVAVQRLIREGKPTAPGYGLGNVKSMEDFEKHIGLDLRRYIASPRSKLGIADDAEPAEWQEKYGCAREQWQSALRTLMPLLPPKNIAVVGAGSNTARRPHNGSSVVNNWNL